MLQGFDEQYILLVINGSKDHEHTILYLHRITERGGGSPKHAQTHAGQKNVAGQVHFEASQTATTYPAVQAVVTMSVSPLNSIQLDIAY